VKELPATDGRYLCHCGCRIAYLADSTFNSPFGGEPHRVADRLILDARLIPLPDDGSGWQRFGLPARAKRGRPIYPKKPKPPVKQGYIPTFRPISTAPSGSQVLSLPARIVIYCPNCRTAHRVRVSPIFCATDTMT
jgi:hypothetical protein